MATAMTCDEIRDLAPAYVLGALEADEERLVAEHLATCPEAHAEFSELGSVVPYLGEQVTLVEPPPALRQRIMAAAAGDLASRRRRAVRQPDRRGPGRQWSPLEQVRRRRRVEIGDPRPRASPRVLAIVALGGVNLVTQQQLNAARDLQARTRQATRAGSPARRQVAVLRSTTPGGPGGIAVMPATGSGTLVMSGLDADERQPGLRGLGHRRGGRRPCPWARSPWAPTASATSTTCRRPTDETVTVAITLEAQPDPPAPTTPVIAAGVAAPPAEPRPSGPGCSASRVSADGGRPGGRARPPWPVAVPRWPRPGAPRAVVPSAGNRTTPTDTLTAAPPTGAPASTPSSTRRATAGPAAPGAIRTNSSPPARATVSTRRTDSASTEATARRTSSPTPCPNVSLIAVRPSTSKIASEISLPCRAARASSSSRTRREGPLVREPRQRVRVGHPLEPFGSLEDHRCEPATIDGDRDEVRERARSSTRRRPVNDVGSSQTRSSTPTGMSIPPRLTVSGRTVAATAPASASEPGSASRVRSRAARSRDVSTIGPSASSSSAGRIAPRRSSRPDDHPGLQLDAIGILEIGRTGRGAERIEGQLKQSLDGRIEIRGPRDGGSCLGQEQRADPCGPRLLARRSPEPRQRPWAGSVRPARSVRPDAACILRSRSGPDDRSNGRATRTNGSIASPAATQRCTASHGGSEPILAA